MGQITFRDWYPVGVEEYGYVAPDPLDPNIIYGGKVTRFDRTTGQMQDVGPEAVRTGKYRFLRTAPLLFSPVDPKVLYLGGNVLFKTSDGGRKWDVISPDLSREKPEVPESIGVYRTEQMANQRRRGVIYTGAPSYKDADTICAGTDDGLIHVTRDGSKTWKDVTPPGLTAWSKVSLMDAGRFDAATAYAAVNRIRLDDQKPHVYRTHDGGKTWQEIVHGLPDDAPVNVVREDPERKGLLFAGTERAVFVSFNDGDDWQPLRLNMPATSIRDLVIHDDDVVVGTHGRSFWILDDITPLRQLDAKVAGSKALLFKPQVAIRVRWNTNTDTPLPPEEPGGQNPPDGALIDYYLKDAATGPVTLEILDAKGKLVRRYSSTDKPQTVDEKTLTIPSYWIRPPQVLSAAAGSHRFVWDLRYPPSEGRAGRGMYPMTAVHHDTPSEPHRPRSTDGQRHHSRTTADREDGPARQDARRGTATAVRFVDAVLRRHTPGPRGVGPDSQPARADQGLARQGRGQGDRGRACGPGQEADGAGGHAAARPRRAGRGRSARGEPGRPGAGDAAVVAHPPGRRRRADDDRGDGVRADRQGAARDHHALGRVERQGHEGVERTAKQGGADAADAEGRHGEGQQ